MTLYRPRGDDQEREPDVRQQELIIGKLVEPCKVPLCEGPRRLVRLKVHKVGSKGRPQCEGSAADMANVKKR